MRSAIFETGNRKEGTGSGKIISFYGFFFFFWERLLQDTCETSTWIQTSKRQLDIQN